MQYTKRLDKFHLHLLRWTTSAVPFTLLGHLLITMCAKECAVYPVYEVETRRFYSVFWCFKFELVESITVFNGR